VSPFLKQLGLPSPRSMPADENASDALLRAKIDALCEEGSIIFDAFDRRVREREFHPFVPADYATVRDALFRHRAPGARFLEWGSATGVITIMADLLGFDAYGIELDASLVTTARLLAKQFDSRATFVAGSFIPTGYRWRATADNEESSTTGDGPSGYLQLGHALDDFDVVFGYPWSGEASMMLDLMRAFGRNDALFLLNDLNDGVRAYRNGRSVVR
jgi:hypothetical protein